MRGNGVILPYYLLRFLKDYLLHDYKSEIHEFTKKVEREFFLDKNGLTNILRLIEALFLAFLFFFIFEVPLDLK